MRAPGNVALNDQLAGSRAPTSRMELNRDRTLAPRGNHGVLRRPLEGTAGRRRALDADAGRAMVPDRYRLRFELRNDHVSEQQFRWMHADAPAVGVTLVTGRRIEGFVEILPDAVH